MTTTFTDSLLCRLTSEALLAGFGQAAAFDFRMVPGCASVSTGVPVADLNYVIAGQGAQEEHRFADACRSFLARELPFLAIVFPEVATAVEATARELGLEHVTDFPFMVRDDAPVELGGNTSVQVWQAQGPRDALANARVLSRAFGMPEDLTASVLPASVFEAPGVATYLASTDGDVVGSVTLVHHGRVTGIWSMAVEPDRQRSGIGRRLLTSAMAQSRSVGAEQFYLGATPAGQPLYESLGFTTRTIAPVWASGETHQA